MTSEPKSDAEWTIRALNVQGTIFEKWCEDTVRRTGRWEVVVANHPVEVVDHTTDTRFESAVDIVAQHGKKTQLFAPIECKKNNPEFIQWVFQRSRLQLPFTAREHRTEAAQLPAGWTMVVKTPSLFLDATRTDDGRETRGTYQDYKGGSKTKTANNAINDAAHQVAIAHQALVGQDAVGAAKMRMSSGARRPQRRIFLPMIVTTAKLAVMAFDPQKVDPATGEIPMDAALLTDVDRAIYEYPIPPHLQMEPLGFDTQGEIDTRGSRLDIVIVQSSAFASFLKELEEGLLTKLVVHELDEADAAKLFVL